MAKQEYKVIVKASALSGSAGVVTILTSFLRIKTIAVFAGAQGVGMLGLFTSAINLVSAVTSLGLGSSAVRDVAASVASEDSGRAASVIVALRRLTWLTGIAGAITCLILAPAISRWTFGADEHAGDIAVLSVCVLLAQLSAGQGALLRGLRKIKELAIQSTAIAVLILVLAVIVFSRMEERGVVPFMILAHVVTLAGTWWFARKINSSSTGQTIAETAAHAKSMIGLGLAFQASGMITTASTHLIGIMIFDMGGSQLNGYYQAAWGSTGALAGLVLGAMGQDFYPRLAAVSTDGAASMRLINQQTEVGILMALPMLALFSSTASILIPLLFSAEFTVAVPAVGWFALGAFGRVISWPLGFYLIAAGRGWWFFATELGFCLVHLTISFWLIQSGGLEGAGIAWFALYMIYWAVMALIVGKLCGQFSGRSALTHSCFGLIVLAIVTRLGPIWGLCMCIPLGFFCLRSLIRRVGTDNQISQKLISLPLIGKFFSS